MPTAAETAAERLQKIDEITKPQPGKVVIEEVPGEEEKRSIKKLETERRSIFKTAPRSPEVRPEDIEQTKILLETTRRAIRQSPLAEPLESMLTKTLPPERASFPEEQIVNLKEPLATAVLAPFAGEPLIEEKVGPFLPRTLKEENRQALLSVLEEGLTTFGNPRRRGNDQEENERQEMETAIRSTYEALSSLYSVGEKRFDGDEEKEITTANIMGTTRANPEEIGQMRQQLAEATEALLTSGFPSEEILRAIEYLPQEKSQEAVLRTLAKSLVLYRELEESRPDSLGFLRLTAGAMSLSMEKHEQLLAGQADQPEEKLKATQSYRQSLEEFKEGLENLLGEPIRTLNEEVFAQYRHPDDNDQWRAKRKLMEAGHPASTSALWRQVPDGSWRVSWSSPDLLAEEDIDRLLMMDALPRIQRKTIGRRLTTGERLIPATRANEAFATLCQAEGINEPTSSSFSGSQDISANDVFKHLLKLMEKRGTVSPCEKFEHPYWARLAAGFAGSLVHQIEAFPQYGKFLQGNENSEGKEGLKLVSLEQLQQLAERIEKDGHQLPDQLPEKQKLTPDFSPRKLYQELEPYFVGVPESQARQLVDFYRRMMSGLDRCGFDPLDPLKEAQPTKIVPLITGPTGAGKTDTITCLNDWFQKNALARYGINLKSQEVPASRLVRDGIEGIHVNDFLIQLIEDTAAEHNCSVEEAGKRLSKSAIIAFLLDEAEHLVAAKSTKGEDGDMDAQVRTQLLQIFDPRPKGDYMVKMPPDNYGKRKIVPISLRRIFGISMAAFSSPEYQTKLREARGQKKGAPLVNHTTGSVSVESKEDLIKLLKVDPALAARFTVIPLPAVTEERFKEVLATPSPRNPLNILKTELTATFRDMGFDLEEVFPPSDKVLDLLVKAVTNGTLREENYRAWFPVMRALEGYFAWQFPQERVPIGRSGKLRLNEEEVREALGGFL